MLSKCHDLERWHGTARQQSASKRVGMLDDDNELDLLADFHAKADLGEGCILVGRYLGLL